MAIKGSLKEASLPDVLQLLSMGKKSGCLSVTHRQNFGYIYFDKGRICYASIVNRRDRLGDILVKNGEWEKGVEIYQRIKGIQDYDNWPLKDFLDERIRDAQANVEHFRVDYTKRITESVTRPAMLVDTGYICVSCHQAKGSVAPVPNFPGLAQKGRSEAPARVSP